MRRKARLVATSPGMTARTAWALCFGALTIPIIALVWLNGAEIAHWFAIGIGPGGPWIASPRGAVPSRLRASCSWAGFWWRR